MTVTIEQELAKGFAKHRNQTIENFLKLTADHLISEVDLENGEENKENRIVLRSDHKLNDEIRSQVKDGYVFEDNVMLRTDASSSSIIAPVYNQNKDQDEITILLVAIFETGAKIPKVGRIRLKRGKEGTSSVSFTDHRNEFVGTAKIKQGYLYEKPLSGTDDEPTRKTKDIYIDGWYFFTFPADFVDFLVKHGVF